MASLYNMSPPYNPHFALPANVLAESPGRGTITTAQLPRRTFGIVPPDWNGCGYVLPDYIRAEPHGRGTAIHTYQRRRRTVPTNLLSLKPLNGLSGTEIAGVPLWAWGVAAGVGYYLWSKKR